MMHGTLHRVFCITACLATHAAALAGGQVLTVNPGFLDTDGDGRYGDGWTVFGDAALAFTFFGDGDPGHATLFGGNVSNTGGVYQAGLAATPAAEYHMAVRLQWEREWDARTRLGLVFYAADGVTVVGSELIEIADDSALAGLGYRSFGVTAAAPAGAVFVRPIVRFESVRSNGASRACTVDHLVVTRAGGCNDADLAEPFGVLDLGDITVFVDAFVSHDPAADLDGNGVFDLTDITMFAGAFLGGCP